MKILKSIASGLFFLLSIAIVFSSCGKEQVTPQEDIVLSQDGIVVSDDVIVVEYSGTEFPETGNIEAIDGQFTFTEDAGDQPIESRSCYSVAYLSKNAVCWYGPRTLALWIYHYDSACNYVGYTRIDHNSSGCPFKGSSYFAPSNRVYSQAFVGYMSNGSKCYPNNNCCL